MSIIVGVIIGFFAGVILLGFPEGVVGAITGWLVGKVLEQSDKIKRQDEQLRLISKSIQNIHLANVDERNDAKSDNRVEGPTTVNDHQEFKSADESIQKATTQKILNENKEELTVISPAVSSTLFSRKTLPLSDDIDDTQQAHYQKAIQRSVQTSSLQNKQELGNQNDRKGNADKETISTSYSGLKLDIQLPEFVNSLIEKTSVMTKIGVVILFFGVAFLLKYASENVSVSIEVRLLGVVAGGLLLFLVGWRMRNSRPSFSVLLQGAAIGVLYLVTFAAMKMYSVISPSLGFGLLFVLSLIAALLSVKQDAKSLAIFGILGGFLSPILASTGSGSHVMLFGYYAILNLGILSIVWFKAWRSLTLMGFAFTFIISSVWGVTQYSAELFASTEPFLLLYFVFYVAVVMIFALRKQWAHNNVLDGPLVYGTPVIVFALQSVLVERFEYGLAWSSLGFGLFYLLVVAARWRLFSERSILLRESFLAIGCIFVSLSIPFAFDYDVSALLWALEGVGALWLAVRQQRIWGCLLAILAQIGAGVFWILDLPDAGEQLFFNPAYLTAAGISLVGFFAALLLRNEASKTWAAKYPFGSLSNGLLCWAVLWWFVGGLWQLEAHIDKQFAISATLIFVALSCLVLQILRKRFKWDELTPILFMLLPVICLLALASDFFIDHPSENYGWLAWPLTIACLYWMYNKANLFVGKLKSFERLWHGVTFLLGVLLVSWEAWWQINEVTYNPVWQNIGVGLVSLCAIWLILKIRFWKMDVNSLYQETVAGILFVVLFLNFISCCFLIPNVKPLPYIPLLNPLGLWQIAIILSAAYWWKNHFRETKFIPDVKTGWIALVGLLFIFLNTLLLRTLHVFADIPFASHALFNNDLVQMCISIFWAMLGIGLFVLAKRFVKKEFWILGVVLFSVVVLKLFVIDLANSGTVERIVSFIAVGLLLLGVGYIKPEMALGEKK
ncbi:MAG: DUF2339 domain-containing protein [Cellvibrionaceae bacterium]